MSTSVAIGAPKSRPIRFAAYALLTMNTLFLVFDAVGKILRPQPVVDAFTRLGIAVSQAEGIGVLLLVLVVMYVIPRTRFIGSVLLVAYLGGAVAIQLRAGSAPSETTFPIIVGILVSIPTYLLDKRVRALFS